MPFTAKDAKDAKKNNTFLIGYKLIQVFLALLALFAVQRL